MFIEYGNKRINMGIVKDYKPYDKSTIIGKYYQIKFTLITGEEDYFHFFDREEDRDNFLNYLDENLLKPSS